MAIDTSLLLSNHQQQQKNQTAGSGDYLGKDAFMKILMTQLQNQDAMNPMEDKDFIAQMAQFSTLEQMTNMTASFEKLSALQQQSQLISYNQFMGKDVKWHKLDETESGSTVQEGIGKIKSIQYTDGSVQFTLEDGTKLSPANISEIVSGGNSLVGASELIGKTVSWKDGETENAARVLSVSMKNGNVVYELDDAEKTKLTADQIIKIVA